MTSMAGSELLVSHGARCTGLEGIMCKKGPMLKENRSKAWPKVMAWKGAQARLWMVLGAWGSS